MDGMEVAAPFTKNLAVEATPTTSTALNMCRGLPFAAVRAFKQSRGSWAWRVSLHAAW